MTMYWQGKPLLYTSAQPEEMPWSVLQFAKRGLALAFGPMLLLGALFVLAFDMSSSLISPT